MAPSVRRLPREPLNLLLRNLPPAEYRKLAAHLEPVRLAAHAEVYESQGEIRNVYFPETMMISLVTEMEDGTTVEMGIVGRYGMAGLGAFLGSRTVPSAAFVQVPGEALRMGMLPFRKLVTPSTRLYARLLLYTQSFLVQSGQAAACNALHTVRQRCARWLLMVADQTGSNSFRLTQEFLSQMLGVRRAGVTGAEGSLRKKGLIGSSRGTISIRDRKGLEAVACECYQVIRAESDRLIA
jgi:CRP-like cAMP-binding protein